MSIELRVKYQVRYLHNFFRTLRLPGFLKGTAARVMLLLLVIFFGLGYILETSSVSTTGYEIHALEKEISLLTNEIRNLETEIATYQSMASIKERLSGTDLVATGNISYLEKRTETSVAQR